MDNVPLGRWTGAWRPGGTAMTLGGNTLGSVGRTYNNHLLVASRSVGSTSIAYGYDRDDLLTSAGAITLTQ